MTVRRSRDKWIVDIETKDGERFRRVSPVQTKRGAQEYERELLSDSSTLTRSSVAAAPAGFREFAIDWLKSYVVANNKPSEVVSKESTLRVHLIPFFENFRLRDIGPRDVERYKAEKLATGQLSAKTINNHLVVLRKLLVTAEEWEAVDRVPRIRRLSVPPCKFDWLTREESERFLASVEKHYPQWRAFFFMALRTGMRRGELFGVFWDDVDLVAETVTVRRSVYRGSFVSPKNGRERTIPMTPKLTAILKAHQAVTRLRGDLVYPAADGKASHHQDHIDRPLHGALKRAGLRRIRFHDLRHSFASQLVSAGRSVKEVQELLGHQSIQMTMRYAHLAPGRMRAAVNALEDGTDVETPERFGTTVAQNAKTA